MQWTDLLSTARLSGSATQHRNEFDDDYKRIVTSPSFRRLQDKTQVFPLERMDFIHTRLTHSLEVAMIGRTLVSEIALSLADQLEGVTDSELAVSQQEFIVRQADIARIVECASLLHDIGNPPYGHFGEDIIRQWFKKRLPAILSEQLDPQLAQDFLASDYVHDLYHFEGNAQALRIAAKLHDFKGSFVGLDLTVATLNTILKYTRASHQPKTGAITHKKVGYFHAEADLFQAITSQTGASSQRHPLTFILEAADDIAYLVADMEDALGKGVLTFAMVKADLLASLKQSAQDSQASRQVVHILETIDEEIFSINRFFEHLRNVLIAGATQSFVTHYADLMAGTYDFDLFKDSDVAPLYHQLRSISEGRIYDHKSILRLEIAGYSTLTYLLDSFVPPLVAYDTARRLDYVDLKKIGIISESQKRSYHYFAQGKSELEKLYLRLLLATDFISGMTDSYAHQLYLDMVGIS